MNQIHPTAIIYSNVRLGDNITIGPYCVIGAPPEHRDHYHAGRDRGVIIHDGTVLAKAVVIDSGIEEPTRIGKNCFLMSGSHVGHDADIRSGVTLAPKACIGGHAVIDTEANIGMGAVVHQRATVHHRCMIGMGAVVTMKASMNMEPLQTWAGNPARFVGMNKKWKS
jgi:UDP-N-acetylglucosamine acyltransferase